MKNIMEVINARDKIVEELNKSLENNSIKEKIELIMKSIKEDSEAIIDLLIDNLEKEIIENPGSTTLNSNLDQVITYVRLTDLSEQIKLESKIKGTISKKTFDTLDKLLVFNSLKLYRTTDGKYYFFESELEKLAKISGISVEIKTGMLEYFLKATAELPKQELETKTIELHLVKTKY